VSETKKTKTEQVALFRYGVIADLLHLQPGTKGLYRMLEEKAAKTWPIPFSTRCRVAEETIRTWLRSYRNGGGFEALKRRCARTRAIHARCRKR